MLGCAKWFSGVWPETGGLSQAARSFLGVFLTKKMKKKKMAFQHSENQKPNKGFVPS